MERASSGYSSAHRPVMKTVAGTFSFRSVAISAGLSNRSPAAARGPWSAVMSASKVRATSLPSFAASVRGPCSKTGVRPAGPGASVGGPEGAGFEAVADGEDGADGADGAGRGACGVSAVPQAVRAAPRTQSAVARRTRVITVRP